MAIKIGHASIDERGDIYGGKVGDQTGKEICIRDWYNKNWDYYIECKDPAIAEKASQYMEQICNNSSYGYDQYQRFTGYDSIKANGGKVAGGKGEFDCSSLVASCYALAGVNFPDLRSIYTGNMKSNFEKTGLFNFYNDRDHRFSDKYATRGGIYLNIGSHVVMALGNAQAKPQTEEKEKKTVMVELEVLRKGNKGINEIYTLQRLLKALGYKGKANKTLAVDGSFGGNTEFAVKTFQHDKGLEVDGVVGKKTWKALLT